MSDSVCVNVLMEPELDRRLSGVAEALDRPKSSIIRQAVEDYVALQEWQLSAIDEGLKATEEGPLVPHEAVEEWVKSWNAPGELPIPKCG